MEIFNLVADLLIKVTFSLIASCFVIRYINIARNKIRRYGLKKCLIMVIAKIKDIFNLYEIIEGENTND